MLRKQFLIQAAEGEGTGGGAPPKETPPADWRSSLPDDIKAEPSLQTIMDVPSLAKSYVHAQKMMGSDKIHVPSQHATEDDWKQIFHKLGNPQKAEEYKLERPKDASFDDEFVNSLKSQAHKLGILPKQGQALVNWLNETTKAHSLKLAQQFKSEMETGLNGLKQEWGQAYSAKLARSNQLVGAAGEEFNKLLVESGLNNHPTVIKAFAAMSEKLSEDSIPADSGSTGLLTPAEADQKIAEIYGNPDHPYNKAMHPGHKGAVEEMSRLFAAKYPQTVDPKTEGKFPRLSS